MRLEDDFVRHDGQPRVPNHRVLDVLRCELSDDSVGSSALPTQVMLENDGLVRFDLRKEGLVNHIVHMGNMLLFLDFVFASKLERRVWRCNLAYIRERLALSIVYVLGTTRRFHVRSVSFCFQERLISRMLLAQVLKD